MKRNSVDVEETIETKDERASKEEKNWCKFTIISTKLNPSIKK